MKKGRGKYSSIQHGDPTPPVTSLWAVPPPSGVGGGGGGGGRESNGHARHSYQSIPSSASASPANTLRRPMSGYQSSAYSPAPSGGSGGGGGGSIRNSAHSRTNALCLRQLQWCVGCYESKLITIEPVLFIVMFAVYLQKIVFELYTFNAFGRHAISDHARGRGLLTDTCVNVTSLKNVTYEPERQRYRVNGLLWTNASSTGDIVEAETGLLILMANVALGVMSIFGTLMLGPLSNRFGRKPALLTILAGMVLQAVLILLIVELDLNVHLFVLGSCLRGVTGGVAGVYSISYSYISEFDRDRKWMVIRIGVIETLSFLAVALGLVMGGVSIDELRCQFGAPAYIILGFIVCAFFYTLIATSESHDHIFATVTSRNPVPRKEARVHASPQALLEGAGLFFGRSSSPRLKLWLGVVIMAVTVMNTSGMTAVLTLYLLHPPLVFNPLYIGGFLGTSEFLHGLVLVVGLPVLLSMGVHDGTIIGLSILLTISMNITLGFADAAWQVFLGERKH